MSPRILIPALSVASVIFAGRSDGAGSAMTLREAYERAEARSESLEIGRAEWRAAEARYQEAMGAPGPDFRAEVSGVRRDEAASGAHRDTRFGFGATWTIFNGFRTLHESTSIRAESQALERDIVRSRQLLYQDVADLFFQTLAFDGELRALAQQVEALENLVRDLDDRIRLGKSRRAEGLAAESQLARTLVAAEELKGSRAAAMELLSFLIGLPASELVLAPPGPLPDRLTVDRFLSEARERPDVQAAESRVAASRSAVDAARADRYPRVEADGNVYVWRDPDDTSAWDVSLRAELPLFDRGLRRSRVAQRVEQVRISELRLSEVRRSSERDVQLAWQQWAACMAQWSALEDAIRLGLVSYEVQREDYALGRASNVDVLDALLYVHELNQRRASLEMRAQACLVRLHVAAGGETF